MIKGSEEQRKENTGGRQKEGEDLNHSGEGSLILFQQLVFLRLLAIMHNHNDYLGQEKKW